jgi:hypothetical protein
MIRMQNLKPRTAVWPFGLTSWQGTQALRLKVQAGVLDGDWEQSPTGIAHASVRVMLSMRARVERASQTLTVATLDICASDKSSIFRWRSWLGKSRTPFAGSSLGFLFQQPPPGTSSKCLHACYGESQQRASKGLSSGSTCVSHGDGSSF